MTKLRQYKITNLNKRDWLHLSTTVSPEMMQKLLVHCRKHEITRSRLIRMLIEEELENEVKE